MFFSGAKIGVAAIPGSIPQHTCFFMANHVNLFDPFVSTAPFRNSSAAGSSNRTSKFPFMAG